MIKKIVVLLLANLFFASQIYAQSQRPNIVFILADDLGYGDLGVYGQKHIKTPNIDKLAHLGLKFTNFYTGTSVCAPSRASLMSGQHTGHTHIRGNKEIMPEGQEPLADSVTTIATLLRNAGYTTGAFGKWGLGMVGTSGDPNVKGFDTFFGYNCQRQSHTFYPDHLWHNNQKVILPNSKENKTVYSADLIQEKALQFLEENKEKPFFLFLPSTLPHAELAGPKDSIYAIYENKFEEKPYPGGHYAAADQPRAMFASMVSRLDFHVGQVLEKLKELNLHENTIILFASDNGAHKEGGADPEFFNSSGGLKGTKRALYEGGIRTPFIAYWPNHIKPNQITHERGAFWDIMPTFVDLAQGQQSAYTDGKSFKNLLLNPKIKLDPNRRFYWEFHEEGGRQALLEGKWKLIIQNAKSESKKYYELFNLEKDPFEETNLAEKHPKQVLKMAKQLQSMRTENPIFPFLKESE